jgi:CubicO group peptidase (beta-lactamase class C family)
MKTLTLFFVCFVQFAFAQTPTHFSPANYNDPERNKRIEKLYPVIEQLYKQYAQANHLPGYAFGIMVDGRLVFKGAGGYANIEAGIPATSATLFRIASMSKSFTAMAILQLRNEGKLQLDDPISKYIPAMKGQALTKDAQPITIRHLMSHSAGFPEDNPWGDRQLADTEADLIALIQKGISFSTSTGTQYEYSNLGFTMLGYIIHKVSGMTYDAYIKKHILLPIGMDATTYEFSDVPKNQLAKGYRYINDAWREEALLHDGIYGAMGGMITSIDMFSKYIALHQNAWPERNDPDVGPIARSSLREMHQPSRFISLTPNYTFPSGRKLATTNSYTYGLNWMNDGLGRVSVGHSGGLPGFGSNWRFMPEYGLGVVFFANRTYAPASVINIAILDTIVQMAQLKPRLVTPAPILIQRQTELVKLIVDWRNNVPIFAENFFDDYPLADLKSTTNALFAAVGAIVKVNPLVAENQLRGYCMIECTKGKLKLSFTLTPQNPALIQEYHLTREE